MKDIDMTTALEKLLSDHPELAERAAQRVGLAQIASLVLQLRNAKGLTQRQLAEKADLSPTLISEIENAANDGITLRTLVKIVRAARGYIELNVILDDAKAGKFTARLTQTHRFSLQAVLMPKEPEEGRAPALAA